MESNYKSGMNSNFIKKIRNNKNQENLDFS